MATIRKATLNDFDIILKLNHELFLYEEKFGTTFNVHWQNHNQGKEYFAKRLVNSNAINLIAEEGKEIVGFLIGFIDSYPVRTVNPVAELENIFIMEDYRGKGIGTLLINEFKKVAKEAGVKRLKLMMHANNPEALNFYKKHGFQEFAIVLEQDLE